MYDCVILVLADHNGLITKQNDLKQEHENLQTDINNVRTQQDSRLAGLNEVFAQKTDFENEMALLREEMTSRLRDLASVKDTNSTGQPHAEFDHSLQADSTQLQTDHKQSQEDVTKLKEEQQKLATDQINLKTQVTGLQTDQEKLNTNMDSVSTYQKTIHTYLTKLHTDIDAVTAEQNTVQTDVAKLLLDMDTVRTDQKTDLAKLFTEMEKVRNDQKTDQTNVAAKLLTDMMDSVRTDQADVASFATSQRDPIATVLAEQRHLLENQDILTSRVHTMQRDIELANAAVVDSFRNTNTVVSALKTRLGKSRQLFDVSFLNKNETKHNQAMIFDTVKTNENGHYNVQSGVFKAPDAGLYFFTITVGSCTKDSSVFGHIMVDEVRHCVVKGGFDGESGCVMVPLTPGQEVRVRAVSTVGRYSSIYSWFRGVFVL
ncbi:hypothetical protein ACOMHN_053920 [Nucella lapillus]